MLVAFNIEEAVVAKRGSVKPSKSDLEHSDSRAEKETKVANEQHVQRLRANVESWNSWRAEQKIEKPDLSGADLSGLQLAGANLQRADLHDASLQGSDLSNSNLSEAQLWHANLAQANLSTARLDMADLRDADVSDAVLFSANLTGANLMQARLHSADLFAAVLTDAQLTDADLSNADIRRIRGLILDNTTIRETRFSAGARDPWSLLRRRYTGPMLMFHLIFLLVYLAPHFFGAGAWIFVNRAQSELTRIRENLMTANTMAGAAKERSAHELRLRLAEVWNREGLEAGELAALNGLVTQSSDLGTSLARSELHEDLLVVIDKISPCMSSNCTPPRPVLLALLGYDQSRVEFVLALCLVAYNLLRAVLTWRVSLLRDVEERSGYSPGWASYRPLFYLNAAATAIFSVAAAAFVYHAWRLLVQTTVVLPLI